MAQPLQPWEVIVKRGGPSTMPIDPIEVAQYQIDFPNGDPSMEGGQIVNTPITLVENIVNTQTKPATGGLTAPSSPALATDTRTTMPSRTGWFASQPQFADDGTLVAWGGSNLRANETGNPVTVRPPAGIDPSKLTNEQLLAMLPDLPAAEERQ